MKQKITALEALYISFPFILSLTANLFTYTDPNEGTVIPFGKIIFIIIYLVAGIILFKNLRKETES